MRPLLIGQGANDPRVKQWPKATQIVQAMQAKKIPVTYVLYPDEGHGFNKPNNRIGFNARGGVLPGPNAWCGRVEPLGETVAPIHRPDRDGRGACAWAGGSREEVNR